MKKKSQQEYTAIHNQLKKLQGLWKMRAKKTLKHRPLDGIYCVYSMYWHPDPRKLHL